ncbi:hypothetical protein K491DRAFT_551660, partial [Lophiostoma macrostomum CBS 122681]
LPIEIEHKIMGYSDLASLLIVRRVNKKAMQVIDYLPDWRKVLDNAPNVVRMAVGIKTAHRFTLPRLVQRLERRTCSFCQQPAPYFSVFSLTR